MIKEKSKFTVIIVNGGGRKFLSFHTKLVRSEGTIEEEMFERVQQTLKKLSEKGCRVVFPKVSCSLWRNGHNPKRIKLRRVALHNERAVARFINRLRIYFNQAVSELEN